jgi:hypothetical protein
MNRQGSILIGALMVIGFSLLVGVPLLQAANLEHQAAINDQLDAQAFYLAEAGIEHAKAEVVPELQRLMSDENWRPGDPLNDPFLTVSRPSFGPGDYEASVSLTLIETDEGVFSYQVDIESDGWVSSAVGMEKSNSITLPLTVTEVAEGSGEGGPSGEIGPPGGGGTLPGGGGGAGGLPALDVALFAQDSINMTVRAIINGNVVTNTTNQNKVQFGKDNRINGTLEVGAGGNPDDVIQWPWGVAHSIIVSGGEPKAQETNRSFPAVEFPQFPTDLPTRPEINIDGGSVQISADGYYPRIRLNSGNGNPGLLTIHAGSKEDPPRIVRVGNLEANNDTQVVIEGSGTVILYVDSSITFRNQLQLNAGGLPQQLIIYCAGSSLQFTNDSIVHAHVISRSANLNINSQSEIVGSVITGGTYVGISNQQHRKALIYAPNASVNFDSDGTLTGAVFCKSFQMSNDCVLTYDPSIAELFPVGRINYDITFDTGSDSIWSPKR